MSDRYKAAGVDILAGDSASRIAYRHAQATFATRAGRIGQPVDVEGGFSGVIDMGPFCLTFNSDGVGSKALVAHQIRKYDTLGWDLVAMVADDAVCMGAEPTSMVNTLDMERVDTKVVEQLMSGLEAAAREAGCAVVGGEIAELPDGVRGIQWSAAMLGTVTRDRLLDGSRVRLDDELVALHTDNFRSNGFTLLRKILHDRYGDEWLTCQYDDRHTWGEAVLAPCRIFTPLVMALTGGYQGTPKAEIHGVAHVTGGGLKSNLSRVTPKGLKPAWDRLPRIPDMMQRVMDIGGLSWSEAETVWNLGVGMVLITPDPRTVISIARDMGYPASNIGRLVEC